MDKWERNFASSWLLLAPPPRNSKPKTFPAKNFPLQLLISYVIGLVFQSLRLAHFLLISLVLGKCCVVASYWHAISIANVVEVKFSSRSSTISKNFSWPQNYAIFFCYFFFWKLRVNTDFRWWAYFALRHYCTGIPDSKVSFRVCDYIFFHD